MVPVVSYMDIEKRMEEGTTNRTVAATNMNATSRSVSMSMISSLTGVVGWLVGLLVAQRPGNMRLYLRDGFAQTSLRAATLRLIMLIKFSISSSDSMLTPGHSVPALTL